MKYLCSGGFIGRWKWLSEIFTRYPISEFDKNFPARSEQYYWWYVWGKEWERVGSASSICLDDHNLLFQSNMGFMVLDNANWNFQVVWDSDGFQAPQRDTQKTNLVDFDFGASVGRRARWRGVPGGETTYPIVLPWNGFFKTNYWRVFVELTGARQGARHAFYQNLHLPAEKWQMLQANGAFDPLTESVVELPVVTDGGMQKRRLEPYLEVNRHQRPELAEGGYTRVVVGKDFIYPRFHQDWELEAPSVYYVGGRFAHALVTEGFASYVSFLFLVAMYYVLGVFLAEPYWKKNYALVAGSESGGIDDVTPNPMSSRTNGNGKSGDELEARAAKAESRVGFYLLHAYGAGAFKAMKMIATFTLLIFVVCSGLFLYQLSWHCTSAVELGRFGSLVKAFFKVVGVYPIFLFHYTYVFYPVIAFLMLLHLLGDWVRRSFYF